MFNFLKKEREVKPCMDIEWFELFRHRLSDLGFELIHCGKYVLIKSEKCDYACTAKTEVDAFIRGFYYGKLGKQSK